MTNKYPTNNPNGKTGEDFLESIADSIKNLPSIKYLADEVSKLKKISKFATASTMTKAGTGGFVTPPPQMSKTNNKISFFASDMDWHSDIKAAVLLDDIPDGLDDLDASTNYYFASVDNDASDSADMIYKTSGTYMKYLSISAEKLSNSLLTKLHKDDDPNDLGIYFTRIDGRDACLSRAHFGDSTDYSEVYIGDYASILSNKTGGAGRPRTAMVLGNLKYDPNYSQFTPYVISVTNNDLKMYQVNGYNSFGKSNKISDSSAYYDKTQWYFDTDNPNYIGLVLDTPTIVRKGTLLRTYQNDINITPGMYQRHVTNGTNTFIASNGLSLTHADVDPYSGLSNLNNEFSMIVQSENTIMSQYKSLIYAIINKPDVCDSNVIGRPENFSLKAKIGYNGGGLISSVPTAVNNSVLAVRALNDGSADVYCDSGNLPAPAPKTDEGAYYEVISENHAYYQRIQSGSGYVWKSITFPGSWVTEVEKLPAVASEYGNIWKSNSKYYRCTVDESNNTKVYSWTIVSTSSELEGVKWGTDKWSSSRYDANSSAQLRFLGPYDVSMDLSDSDRTFYEQRILGGDHYIGIAAINASNQRTSGSNSTYDQVLSIRSWLEKYDSGSASSIRHSQANSSFINFIATYTTSSAKGYYASDISYSIKVNQPMTMDAKLNAAQIDASGLKVTGSTQLTTAKVTGDLTTAAINSSSDISANSFKLKPAKGSTYHIRLEKLMSGTAGGLAEDHAVAISIDGGCIQYTGKGFISATSVGTYQNDGGTRWFVRPIVIAQNSSVPSGQSQTGHWNDVPNGTIVMGA